jgi:uncharacterized membrane protein YkvA (DUF1232 family)
VSPAAGATIYGQRNLMEYGHLFGPAEASRSRSPLANPDAERRESSPSWRSQVERLRTEAEVFYFAFKHPRVRWYARLIAVCTVGYLFSPVQLIPSYIPFIGFLDDFLVLFLGMKLLRKTIPRDVLTECRRRVDALEVGEKAKLRSVTAMVGAIVIISLWLLATAFAGVLMVRCFRR